MGKSLESLIGDITGAENSASSSHLPILVRCSNCGKTTSSFGYEKDVTCQNCKVIHDNNIELLTSGDCNFARDNIKIKKKISVSIPVVQDPRIRQNTEEDRTG